MIRNSYLLCSTQSHGETTLGLEVTNQISPVHQLCQIFRIAEIQTTCYVYSFDSDPHTLAKAALLKYGNKRRNWRPCYCNSTWTSENSTLCTRSQQRKHQSFVLLFLCEGKPLLVGGFPIQMRMNELWYFLCCIPEHTVEYTVELTVNWDVMTFMCRRCNDWRRNQRALLS